MKTIEKRVRNGVEWLDYHMPDWLRIVDTDELDLTDCDVCVLGQLVKSVDPKMDYRTIASDISKAHHRPNIRAEVIDRLNEDGFILDDTLTAKQAQKRGFHIIDEEGDDEWQNLTDEWRTTINRLRTERYL